MVKALDHNVIHLDNLSGSYGTRRCPCARGGICVDRLPGVIRQSVVSYAVDLCLSKQKPPESRLAIDEAAIHDELPEGTLPPCSSVHSRR